MRGALRSQISLPAVLAIAVGACATAPDPEPAESETLAVIRAGFHERGIAKLDRLEQTDLQKTCTRYRDNPPADVRAILEKTALASVKYPADDRWLGDYKQGERIAQSGIGLQWSDRADSVNGGNCYACHQLTKEEISFGNIGPSLYHYGAQRGQGEAVLRYTWAKIWNTHSFNACSAMPRFGDAGILTAEQVSHVMALLLDPASPVNR